MSEILKKPGSVESDSHVLLYLSKLSNAALNLNQEYDFYQLENYRLRLDEVIRIERKVNQKKVSRWCELQAYHPSAHLSTAVI